MPYGGSRKEEGGVAPFVRCGLPFRRVCGFPTRPAGIHARFWPWSGIWL